MSDKMLICLKFDVDGVAKTASKVKGVFANMYYGYDPFGFIAQASSGMRVFMNEIDNLKFLLISRPENCLMYQRLRSFFDVNFYASDINVSIDLVDKIRNKGKDSYEIITVKDDLFCDSFAQLFIDVTGSEEGYSMKYAFINNNGNSLEIMDVAEFANLYEDILYTDSRIAEAIEDAIFVIDSVAEMMSDEEVMKFNEGDIKGYVFDY